ncbi:MAG: alanine dehydrogenase [Pseudomonadota bacterium]|jgi:alanine dehydrogenase|nr:alanine dehydrogenase [Pseudomonadota bacterium]|tara:strand:+ start:50425 stop:51492 length:1068 start_codon:yes stop_codon:yes gene_type:complete
MSTLLTVGVPKEIKPMEARIALVPHAVADLVGQGCEVWVQQSAGELSGFSDDEYRNAGAQLAEDAAELFAKADLVVKVKEPIQGDLDLLQARHLLFCYLHLAPNPTLTQALCDIGLTAVAFETVQEGGKLPLLAPMSEIAGRVSVQAGIHYLHRPMGGKGILLGGVPGAEPGKVVIIGAGVAGQNAAMSAAATGAQVVAFDRSAAALRVIESLAPNITGVYSYQGAIAKALRDADLVVGSVLIPGAKAPKVVTRDMIQDMPDGGVVVDISIDQGGCIETMRATDYRDPVFLEEGVLHMGVTNMPGAVPRTASEALSGAILPYVQKLLRGQLADYAPLSDGINVSNGKIVLPALIE